MVLFFSKSFLKQAAIKPALKDVGKSPLFVLFRRWVEARRIFRVGTGEPDGFPSAAFFQWKDDFSGAARASGPAGQPWGGRAGAEGTTRACRPPPGSALGVPGRGGENALPRPASTRSDKRPPRRAACSQSLVTRACRATGLLRQGPWAPGRSASAERAAGRSEQSEQPPPECPPPRAEEARGRRRLRVEASALRRAPSREETEPQREGVTRVEVTRSHRARVE